MIMFTLYTPGMPGPETRRTYGTGRAELSVTGCGPAIVDESSAPLFDEFGAIRVTQFPERVDWIAPYSSPVVEVLVEMVLGPVPDLFPGELFFEAYG